MDIYDYSLSPALSPLFFFFFRPIATWKGTEPNQKETLYFGPDTSTLLKKNICGFLLSIISAYGAYTLNVWCNQAGQFQLPRANEGIMSAVQLCPGGGATCEADLGPDPGIIGAERR